MRGCPLPIRGWGKGAPVMRRGRVPTPCRRRAPAPKQAICYMRQTWKHDFVDPVRDPVPQRHMANKIATPVQMLPLAGT